MLYSVLTTYTPGLFAGILPSLVNQPATATRFQRRGTWLPLDVAGYGFQHRFCFCRATRSYLPFCRVRFHCAYATCAATRHMRWFYYCWTGCGTPFYRNHARTHIFLPLPASLLTQYWHYPY